MSMNMEYPATLCMKNMHRKLGVPPQRIVPGVVVQVDLKLGVPPQKIATAGDHHRRIVNGVRGNMKEHLHMVLRPIMAMAPLASGL